MKAFQYHVYGGPEVLQRVDLPRPEAGPGQILIAVHAVGVNPSDWKRRAGLYRDDDPVSFPAGVAVAAAGSAPNGRPHAFDASCSSDQSSAPVPSTINAA